MCFEWSYVSYEDPADPIDVFIQDVVSRRILEKNGAVTTEKFGQSVKFGLNDAGVNANGYPASAFHDCDPVPVAEERTCEP